jgi:hypothetical protein
LTQNFLPSQGSRSRKNVEENPVGGRREIGVLVPVSGQARRLQAGIRELIPFRRLRAVLGEIFRDKIPVCRRQGIVIEREPIAPQDHRHGDELRHEGGAQKDEREQITEPDLRQHVLEREIGHRRVGRAEKDAECDQDQRANERVTELQSPRIAPRLAFRVRKGHRDADHEHECGLNQVPKDTARPGDVIQLPGGRVPKQFPRLAVPSLIELGEHVGMVLDEAGDSEAARNHQQHREAAISIEGHQPLGDRLGSRFRRFLGRR